MVVGSLLLLTGIAGLVNVSVAALALMLHVRTNSAALAMWVMVGLQTMMLVGVLAIGGGGHSGRIETSAEAFALLVHGVVILFAAVALLGIATGPHDP